MNPLQPIADIQHGMFGYGMIRMALVMRRVSHEIGLLSVTLSDELSPVLERIAADLGRVKLEPRISGEQACLAAGLTCLWVAVAWAVLASVIWVFGY